MNLSFEEAVKAVSTKIASIGTHMNVANGEDIRVSPVENFAVRVLETGVSAKPVIMDFGRFNSDEGFTTLATVTTDGVLVAKRKSRSQLGQSIRNIGREIGLDNF